MKCLTGTDAEVLEFIAKEDSPITENKLKEIEFPPGAIIGGFTRDGKGHIARGNTKIEEGDHVVVFALPSAVGEMGKLFSEQ